MDAIKRTLVSLHSQLAGSPARFTVAVLVAALAGAVGLPPWLVDVFAAVLQHAQSMTL